MITVPRLSKSTKICSEFLDFPFSLLGLGDILTPGLSVNYAILFDISSKHKFKFYFIANLIGKYTISLLFNPGKSFKFFLKLMA